MTEAEWSDFFATALWRDNDVVFVEAIPTVIDRTTRAIRRDVEIPSRTTMIAVDVDTDGYAIPPVSRQCIASIVVNDDGRQELRYYRPNIMTSSRMPLDGYTFIDGKIYIGGYPLILNNTDSILIVYNDPLEPWFDAVSGDGLGFQTRHPDFFLAKAKEVAGGDLRDAYMEETSAAAYLRLLESVKSYESRMAFGESLGVTLPGIVA